MTEPTVPTPPAGGPAPTPDQAVSKLAELCGDKSWTDKFLAGNGPELAEYRALSEIAIKSGDKIDKAIAGVLDAGPLQDSSHLQNIGAAAMLREAGMDNDVIRQVLAGEPVTQKEFDAAAKIKSNLMKTPDFVKRYLAGEADAIQRMTLLQIITSSEIKQEARS
jgi:hypothetical protein